MRCLIPLAASAAAVSVRIAAPCPAGTVPWGDGTCESFAAAKRDALKWLRKNAPPSDLRNAATLFGTPGGVDGLDAGVAAVAANATLTAKMRWPWAWGVPRDIFRDYVLPYASANEPRTHWHGLLAKAVEPILNALPRHATISDVAAAINGYGGNGSVWQNVGGVKFHSGQTPLIFDPVSTVAFGYASCTGVSTTYIAALRVAGVPARLVGTPAWLGDPTRGNHNWVEIWDGAAWRFWEGRPAGGGETLANPCDKWFCKAARFPVNGSTKVYAARFDRHSNQTVYPLAWDPSNLDTPGVDRTDAYVQMCSRC